MKCVATIGNFDGVHLGHQVLLQKMQERAKALGVRTCVILFEPYPREFFHKANVPYRIQTLTDKLLKLKEPVHIIHFNQRIADQSPQEFIEKTLKPLGVIELVVGEDFRFGKNRSGGVKDLQDAGIQPIIVKDLYAEHQKLSSSIIRELLCRGDFKAAARMLGEPYRITGRITHGAKHGRLLGFPTLNIALRKKMPLSGVYEVKIYGLGEVKTGVANIGRRPTLNPLAHPLLEIYVLDFDREVYGQRVTVEFVRKIREEQKFASLDALKAQITLDVVAVRV